MLGAIIGDVVGSIYEFNNTKDYNFKLFPEGSKYTDDTVLACAVADWLMHEAKGYYEPRGGKILEDYFVKYGKMFPNPKGGYGTGFATWLFTPELLSKYPNYGDWYDTDTGRHPYNSCGNGAAMRVIPVGWTYPANGEMKNVKLTMRAAGTSASVTHNHPEGMKGADATAFAIWLARCGKTKEEIREEIVEWFPSYESVIRKSWEEIRKDYFWDGTCQGSVPQAIVCFLDSIDFEDAIRKAVSLGGDSDTIGCITGGIAEAFYRDIPSFMKIKALETLPVVLRDIYERFMEFSEEMNKLPE